MNHNKEKQVKLNIAKINIRKVNFKSMIANVLNDDFFC